MAQITPLEKVWGGVSVKRGSGVIHRWVQLYMDIIIYTTEREAVSGSPSVNGANSTLKRDLGRSK